MSLLYDALQLLATQGPDRAEELNGIGFNAYDGIMGHDLASLPESAWMPAQTYRVWNMLRKYKGQLARAGIDYDAIPVPPKANGEGKGSMEVHGGEVLVIFPYDAVLKDDLKGQLPWPTLSFTKYPVPAWLVKGEPDAVRKIAAWAEGKGFTVTDDVWAIANSEPITNSEAQAQVVVKFAPATHAPQANPRRLDWDGTQFVMSFPYSAELVEASKEVPGRSYDKINRRNLYPAQADSVKGLVAFTAAHGFDCTERAKAACQTVLQNHVQAVEASKAKTANLDIPGLGGELRPFQKAAVKYALEHKRVMLCDTMGLGKTIEELALIQAANLYPAVVICPASLKLNWKREAEKWLPGKLIYIVNGRDNNIPTGMDIYIVNYDVLSSSASGDGLSLTGQSILVLNPKVIACDEAHYVKEARAGRSKAVKTLLDGMKWCQLLTGTPLLNRPKELASPLDIIGQVKPVFGGTWKFLQRYTDPQNNGFGWDFSGASNLDELNEKLRANCYVRRTKEEVLTELPAKTRTQVPVQIDNRKEYEAASGGVVSFAGKLATLDASFQASIANLPDAERKAAIRARAGDAEWKAMQAEVLVRINVLRRVAVKGKLAAVKEWMTDFMESEEKLLVFAWHQDVIDQLAKEYNAPKITGETSLVKRDEYVQRFQNDPTCKLMVANIQAGGVGLTLTAASHCAFIEFPWNEALLDQAESRIHRMGQTYPCNSWLLVGEDTIDQYFLETILRKKAVVDAATEGGQAVEDDGILAELVSRLGKSKK